MVDDKVVPLFVARAGGTIPSKAEAYLHVWCVKNPEEES